MYKLWRRKGIYVTIMMQVKRLVSGYTPLMYTYLHQSFIWGANYNVCFILWPGHGVWEAIEDIEWSSGKRNGSQVLQLWCAQSCLCIATVCEGGEQASVFLLCCSFVVFIDVSTVLIHVYMQIMHTILAVKHAIGISHQYVQCMLTVAFFLLQGLHPTQ